MLWSCLKCRKKKTENEKQKDAKKNKRILKILSKCAMFYCKTLKFIK